MNATCAISPIDGALSSASGSGGSKPDQLGTPVGSDVVLDLPGPGNNKAFGHCSLAVGVRTFSGGAGKFTGFHASVDVSANDDFSLWYWNGTYSFNPRD